MSIKPVIMKEVDRVDLDPQGFKPGLYAHYRGGKYAAIAIAHHHQFRDWMVVYVSLTTGSTCVREWATPGKDSWTDIVTWPDGVMRPRFVRLEEQPS